MKYIKALFDIQRVHVDGSSLFYQVYYKEEKSYQLVTDHKFNTRVEATTYIDELLDRE